MKNILIVFLVVIVLIVMAVVAVSMLSDGDGNGFFGGRDTPFSYVGRTDDAGQTWHFSATLQRDQQPDTLFQPRDVLVLRQPPHEALRNFIFAGTRNRGLFVSGDNGATWQHVSGRNGELDGPVHVYDIAFDPRDSNRWYIAVAINDLGQVLTTNDGGQSFASTYHTATEDHAVFGVGVDPFRPDVVYAATAEGLLLQSTNRGREWETLQVYDDPISDLQLHPERSGVMFAIVQNQGLMRSQNRGETFELVGGGAPRSLRGTAISFVIDPRQPHVMALAAPEGLFRSIDSGETWERIPLVIPPEALPIRSVVLSRHSAETLYVAAGFTLYISHDGGTNWELRALPGGVDIMHMIEDARIPQRLYVSITP